MDQITVRKVSKRCISKARERAREKGVSLNKVYQEALENSQTLSDALNNYYAEAAQLIINNLDSVRQESALVRGDQKKLKTRYQWALKFPGGGIDKLVSDTSFVDQLLAAKIKKGIA